MRVNGFYGHIQKNHLRSLVMFMGFMVSMHIAVATLMSIPFPFWVHIPAVFSDPIAYFKTMGVWVSLFNCAFFTVFYFCHTFFLKLSLGFEEIPFNANPRLHRITNELSIMAGIPMPRLDYIAHPALNAFACGLSKNKSHIVVTQGLLDALDDEELKAVIAHEVAHIKNGDMHMMAVANAAIGSIKLVNTINPMKFNILKKIPLIFVVLFFPILAILGILVVFYSFIMQLTSLIASATRYFISSSREYIADAEAVRLTHNPAALVSALSKIHGRSNIHCTNSLTNAMMIDGPTTGKDTSHPPMQDRLQKLIDLSGEMLGSASARKDTRQRSLKAFNGDAYGATYGAQKPARPSSFAQAFQRPPAPSLNNIRQHVPISPDYAEHQGATLQYAEPDSIFDRITEGNDGEYGLDSLARWVVIGLLCFYFLQKYETKKEDTIELSKPQAMRVESIIEYSPAFIVLNLDERALWATRLSQSGTYFDVHNQKKRHRTGWIERGGFLFYDKNRNKKMDGVSELLTVPLDRVSRRNRIESLVQFDRNGNGLLTSKDPEFQHLRIWRDYNKDGVFDAGESHSFQKYGIVSLDIKTTDFKKPGGIVTAMGTRIISQASYRVTPDKKPRSWRNSKTGAISVVSFETDITRYKTPSGEIIAKTPEGMAKKAKPPVKIARRDRTITKKEATQFLESHPVVKPFVPEIRRQRR